MRDTTIQTGFSNLAKYIQQIENSVRLGLTGEVVRNTALVNLLYKKGLITEVEMTEAIGEVIRKANEVKPEEPKTEEAPKVELATPTAEQVADVQKSVVEESKTNG